MEISAHRIAVLLAVQRAGGVVAAADLLHLSPSAVSQQVKLLEKETGVSVLDRTPAGAVLTPAGRVLAEAAERVEVELATARRELAAVDPTTPAGTVRVGAFATAIRAILMPLLSALEVSHPGVELVIEEVEEKEAITRLRHGELDLVLLERDEHALPPALRAMADVPLLDESWLVVVPPGSPPPTSLTDLVGVTWVGMHPGTAGALALNRLSLRLGTTLSARHVAYDYDVVLAMTSQGLGHALLPELAVHAGLVPDDVVVTHLAGLGTRQMLARHRATRSEPSQVVRALLEALVSQVEALSLER